jgi:copper chaperone CopZ
MQTVLEVTGMTCMHCVSAVTRALQKVPGVERAEVSLDKQQAVVTGKADVAAMVAAVKAEGYGARAL